MSTSKKRPTRGAYHHGNLRPALLENARSLLEEAGPEGLALRQIAHRAGVSQAAPYRHFADKEALLAALAEQGFQELAEQTRAAAGRQRDPVRRFVAIGTAYVRFAGENPSLYRLMFGSVRRQRDPAVAEAGGRAFAVLVEAVQACQEAGRFRAAAASQVAGTATSLCHGIAALALDERLPDGVLVEDFAELSLRQLVEGLAERGS